MFNFFSNQYLFISHNSLNNEAGDIHLTASPSFSKN